MQKLLLHTCCAPCSIVIIDELKSEYDLTVFFYNPNIHPEAEYVKRKKEVVKVCREWGVNMIDRDIQRLLCINDKRKHIDNLDYGQDEWHDKVKGLENEPEGGARCAQCFTMRLAKTAQYAKENNFDIFATSLSSGRNKKAILINAIAERHAKDCELEYLSGDWKKGGRQEKGREMIADRDIYRQNYCGCIHSK